MGQFKINISGHRTIINLSSIDIQKFITWKLTRFRNVFKTIFS
jgi:hypothetical protein